MLQPKDRRLFLYPYYGNPDSYPDYSAHSTQIVMVVREITDHGEVDESGEPYDRMYEILADDGWIGHAWESELHDLDFDYNSGKDKNGNIIWMK